VSAVLHGGLKAFALPPLYMTGRNALAKLTISDEEVDQLRIDSVRRPEGVTADLMRLRDRPATLADVLAGPDRLRQLLVEAVPFESAEIAEKAAARLEHVLGADGVVADPRPEYIGGTLTMANVRELVAGMVQLIEPYRRMRSALK
jgi:hypothetical protein